MKPVHERNQECLPPKKRDLPVNNNNNNTSTINNNNSSISGGVGGSGSIGSAGGEDAPSSQSSGVSGEGSGEWVRAQQSMHYGVDGGEGLVGLPVDQYSMLYKVALPAGTYSPTSLHPVLSHISPAYTVPSLQHTSVPYSQIGIAQIPHSSLQFVSSPYAAAVPFAVPPGFVPSHMIPPQSAISQPHSVSHLVPYPSVIQEGVGSSQQQASTHAYTKMGVPLVLNSNQTATQAQLGTVGMLPAGELSPRAVYYHPTIRGVQLQRDLHSSSMEQEREVNGGDREHGGRESHQDAVYSARSAQLLQASAPEPQQDKSLKSRRPEGRMSPGQRSTPDTDLEVQQVVGRLASPVHGMSRKEATHVPLNLSQTSQRRGREIQGEVRTLYASNPAESRAQTQQYVQQGHAVILANGQPVLVPLDYHHQQQPQQHFQSNDVAPATYPKAMETASCPPERSVVDLPPQQGQQPSQQPPGTFPQTPTLAPSGPSHFMKGAIIQLATGELKRVEDLQTQDFVRSAEVSGGLKIDSSMVVDIRASQQRRGLVALHFNVGEQQSKVTIDVPPEHPFFVFGQGWSSCSPERTAQLYGLTCHHLQVGDVCVSVTLQQQAASQQKPPQQVQARTPTKVNSTSGAPPQPMGPPAPQHTPRPQSQLKIERIHREKDRDKEEPMQVGGSRQSDVPPRPNRTSADHTRSQSNYCLHTEGQAPPGAAAGASSVGASQRRWSAPGFQRYSIKNEEGGSLASAATSGSSRLSFIPQEIKLSIEGRSNAGK
ncbi:ataxin-1-like [Carassius auratus]|uniref:Ataxin-1-like n=1 Tax=Carassius auratus TaxID=7957 RepID=A0A6P6KHJ0_CARAU|nr:ataxin-1-like [Carassius auratus]